MMTTDKRKTLGLYFHIPFCKRKCNYCAFCSFPLSAYPEKIRCGYTEALLRQLKAAKDFCKDHIVDTVYFGGGTPSLMTSSEYEKLLCAVYDGFNVSPNAEITSECNPGTVDYEKLRCMQKFGVNRLSFGVQSFNENELAALGRIHSVKDSENAFRVARQAGFDNISIDLMYGIPSQTSESFYASIDSAVSLSPEHISSYALSVEEGTPFYADREKLSLPDDDTVADMYEALCEKLAGHGYFQYEISNFSKPNRESRHNLRYWKGTEYLGFGIAAHSFFDGVRFSVKEDLGKYLNCDFSEAFSSKIIANHGKISPHDEMSEYVMLRLRLAEGFSVSDFRDRFNITIWDFLERDIDEYVKFGYLKFDGERLAFTTKGFCVSNAILSELIGFEQII